jgi:predicted PurR-regulated permease PerM
MDKHTPIQVSITPATIVWSIVIALLFAAAWYLRDIVLVVITSVVLASAIEPGARWFEMRRFPRALGVLLIYLLTFAIIAGMFFIFFPVLIGDTVNLLDVLPTYTESLSVWNPLQDSGLAQLNQVFSFKAILLSLSESLTNLTAGFFTTVSGLFGGIISFALIIILSFYLAVQRDGVGEFLRIVVPIQHESYVIGLWKRSQQKIGLWMQGQLLLGVIITVLTYLGLSVLGVNNALFLAVTAGVTELIPIFGIIIAVIPAVSVAFFQEGITLALLVAGLYLIIQQFESHLIYPLVVKKIIGIPPILTILTLVVGAKLAGFLGILLSVPLAAVFMEVLSDIEKRKRPRE